MRRAFRIGVLAAVGITLALTPRGPASTRGAEACGPFALNFAFVRVASPEDPQAYVAGAIGVVRPSFRLPWLVTAYRHLAGQPLGAAAQQALAGPWEPGVRVPPGTLFGTQRWLKARSEALKEPEAYSHIPLAAFDPATGAYFDNCTEGAFEAAAKTLQERVASLGAATPAVAAWVAAQDQVWANCGRDRGSVAPDPGRARRLGDAAGARRPRLPDRGGVVLRRPVGRRGDALPRHRRRSNVAVAAVGRVPRRARVPAQGHDRRRLTGALADAAAAFAKVAADPASPLRESAAGLVRFIELRQRPDALRPEVAAKLLAPGAGASFSDDLDEYRYLFLRSEPAADAPLASGRGASGPAPPIR